MTAESIIGGCVGAFLGMCVWYFVDFLIDW